MWYSKTGGWNYVWCLFHRGYGFNQDSRKSFISNSALQGTLVFVQHLWKPWTRFCKTVACDVWSIPTKSRVEKVSEEMFNFGQPPCCLKTIIVERQRFAVVWFHAAMLHQVEDCGKSRNFWGFHIYVTFGWPGGPSRSQKAAFRTLDQHLEGPKIFLHSAWAVIHSGKNLSFWFHEIFQILLKFFLFIHRISMHFYCKFWCWLSFVLMRSVI